MSGKRFSRSELIELLRTLRERLGRTPIQRDTYKYPDIPSRSTYVRRFGSWREALKAAGIPLDPSHMGYDRETLLEHLRSVVDELGRAPSRREMTGIDGPHPETYASHFGTWSEALRLVGAKPRTGSRQYGTTELLRILREFAEELGRTPTIAEMKEREDLPSPSTYTSRFRRWSVALKQAGLKPRRNVSHGKGAERVS